MYNIEITPQELNILIKKHQSITLLDVRRKEEVGISNIGGVNIPLNELENRIHELNIEDYVIIYCHHGIRSLLALFLLKQYGFHKVRHLKGGIEAWSNIIDISIKRY